jgi:hypothetical protein
MSEINPQEFGRLQAQVETLIASDAEKTELLKTMAVSISAIQLQLAEARGGWRLLVALGGMSGTIGAVIAWFAHEILRAPK